VDLEAVPAPLLPPAAGTYLSITDYGANGSDANDDTTAIQNCITDAKAQGKTVWMPAGTYYQSANFTLDGVTVQGAGMWYTNLVSTIAGTSFAGKVGFFIKGTGSKVTDMSITSTAHTTRSTPGGKPFTSSNSTPPTNWTVQNVWITHTEVGFWMSTASNGTVSGCRIRSTYADGINLNGGASNNLLEHNHIRGTGDDGLATFSGTGAPICTGNTFRFNTVINPWGAHNCALWGCDNQLVEDNYFADNATMGTFAFNLSGVAAYPVTNTTIRRNTLVRGGGNAFGQKRGAIWSFAGNQTISTTAVRDNDIRDSIFRGIHLAGTLSQAITFERNVVDHPGENGVQVLSGVTGTGTFNNNIVRNLNATFVQFSNGATSPGYTVTLSGNTW
jgi:parallel beta-helix repeat protein